MKKILLFENLSRIKIKTMSFCLVHIVFGNVLKNVILFTRLYRDTLRYFYEVSPGICQTSRFLLQKFVSL